jgi:putative FmdB family regulatory protein
MPIYQYRCRDCGQVSEFLLPRVSVNMDSACSVCGSRNLDKLISAPSLLKNRTNTGGKTCCGREERCETPACATGNGCRRR